ncbi:Hypothetical predicted protein [Scomber scombrus]|uniref:Uncharacterized protein n=1 Tax=Scomber scombrus TaxID=13677 RepID=A0AAV1NYM0_SCOSC
MRQLFSLKLLDPVKTFFSSVCMVFETCVAEHLIGAWTGCKSQRDNSGPGKKLESVLHFFAVPEVLLDLVPSHYRNTAGGKVMHRDDFLRALAEPTGQSH